MSLSLPNNKALHKGVKRLSNLIYNTDADLHTARKRAYWEEEGGIVRFVREVIGTDPKPYQERILNAVQKYRRVAAKSLRGVGKTTTAAWVGLYVLTCAPGEVKVVCTASVWEQLKRYLFPEIRKWALKANWEYIGVVMRDKKELLLEEINLDAGQRSLFATSPGQTDRIEGAHAETLLYIFDESKIIPPEVFDAIEGAFSTKGTNAFAFAVSTPGAPLGRFYDIMKHKAGYADWHTENVSYAEAIEAGAIEEAWAENRKTQWGVDDPRYKNQVLGDFADSSDFGLIKRSWVQAAQSRWVAIQGTKPSGKLVYGVDPADTGSDKTAIAKFIGEYCEYVQYFDEEVMEVVPRLMKLIGPMERQGVDIAFDGLGIGAGAYQTIRNLGYRIHNLKASAKAIDRFNKEATDSTGENSFFNMRAAMYWALREALDPNSPAYRPIALPPDERLEADLVAPEWSETRGVIKILEKDKIREKLGDNRSPDGGDAVVMAWWLVSGGGKRHKVGIHSL